MFRYIAALLLFASPAYAWDLTAMNRQIDQTNFLVNDGCSGTLIATDLVLTAAHCVLDQYETVEKDAIDDKGRVTKEKYRVIRPGTVSQLYFSGPAIVQKNSYVYKVVGQDQAFDLALLRLQAPVPSKDVSRMACAAPGRGDTVYAVGNSFAVLYSTVTKGTVSSVTRSYRDLRIAGQLGDLTDNGEHGLVQHSAVIAPGNSGGALYNDSGDFVGVNVRGAGLGGFSFAVPLDDIKSFLSANGAQSSFAHCAN